MSPLHRVAPPWPGAPKSPVSRQEEEVREGTEEKLLSCLDTAVWPGIPAHIPLAKTNHVVGGKGGTGKCSPYWTLFSVKTNMEGLWVEASLPHSQLMETHPNSWLSPMVHLFAQTLCGSYLPTVYSPGHRVRGSVLSRGPTLSIHLNAAGFFKHKSCLLFEDGSVFTAIYRQNH